MAVTAVTVYQDNIIGSNNLVAVHSPLVFLIDVTYTGAVPVLMCDITIDGVTPVSDDATMKCVFHSDISPTVRRFMFRADSMLRAFMEDFEDFIQTSETVVEVLKVKQEFVLVFYDSGDLFSDTVNIIAFHAKRQFGQTPAISEIYANEDILYIAGSDKPVYIYFFNDSDGAIRTITDGTTIYNLTGSGGEEIIATVNMSSWEGVGYETAPVDWDIWSITRTATWRIYENPAGEATWIMHGAIIGQYFGLRNNVIQWDKGEEVWLRVTYKGGGANVYLGAIEKALYGGSTTNTGNLALPYSATYVTVEVKFTAFTGDWLIPGPRVPFVVLLGTASPMDIDVQIDSMVIYKPTSRGYYRLKVSDLDADTTYQLKEGVTVLATKTVRVKEFCTGSRYMKYLDRNGQYRFYPFNPMWETKDSPKKIGQINQLITNILIDQGGSKSVGYTNDRKLTLVADDVLNDELDILSDVYTSPRVYLEIGDGTTDEAKDWVRVDVVSSDNLVRRKKGNTSKVQLTVTLPEWYNITML